MFEGHHLVWKLRQGDVEALRQVYLKYKDSTYTTASALLNDYAAAEDVLHDAFVMLAKAAPSFGLYRSVKNYLAACVINRSEEILHRKMYKVVEVPRTSALISESADSGEPMTHEEDTAAVMDAMAEVPLPQREAVTLYLHGGLSFTEIAQVQRVSLHTAKARYRYGLEKLKGILEGASGTVNGLSDIENRLRNIRLSTSSQADERIVSDATAEFERAVKVQAGRSWRTIAGAAAVIIILAAAAVFLMHPGEAEQVHPQVTERLEVPEQAVQREEPVQRPMQPALRRREITQADRLVGGQVAEDDTQAKLARIASLAATGDVNSLAAILETGDLTSKMAAVRFLSRMPDERAAAALDRLAEKLDLNEPQDRLLAELLGVEDFGTVEEAMEKAEAAEAKAVNEPNTAAVERERPSEHYVTGWLTDVNGYAVEGRIRLGQGEVATDANGAFSIARPSFSDFISSFGYAISNNGELGTVFHWNEDEDLNDTEIVCMPFASASGSVVDVNSQPVNDCRMEIVPEVSEQSIYARGELKGPWEIKMDTDGSFEIISIPTGYPLVLVVSKDDLSRRIPLDEPDPGEHVMLGEIVLEAGSKEDSIPKGG